MSRALSHPAGRGNMSRETISLLGFFHSLRRGVDKAARQWRRDNDRTTYHMPRNLDVSNSVT